MGADTAPIVDLDAARAAEARRKQTAALDATLAKSDKGVVLGCLSNLILIMDGDPELRGIVGFNEFTHSVVLFRAPPVAIDGKPPQPGPYPRGLTDADGALIQSYIQRAWARQASKDATYDAITAAAADNRFHPVRDWLGTLAWDGVPRLDTWMIQAYGAEDTDYTRDVCAKILIAACRRVRQPGCKFDNMLILEGEQGIRKSSSLEAMFSPPWFSDSLPAGLHTKDAADGLRGMWCIEFGEIEQIIRAEVEVIKAFLSRRADRFRPSYGRNWILAPRQCVLVGTTNASDYLRDATGNRRFWPIACQFVDLDWLAANREQLWAEAATREARGEPHWFTDSSVIADAKAVQAERLQDDSWHDRIVKWLDNSMLNETAIPDILTGCLEIPPERQRKAEEMRVARILQMEGWERKLIRRGKPVRRWTRG